MTLITIRETSQTDAGWQVAIRFDHGPAYRLEVSNPFSEEEEKRLEWYFEQWLKFPFANQVKARKAAQSVVAYGEQLFKQVLRSDFGVYAQYKAALGAKGIGGLSFEISGGHSFHALHWEALKDPALPRPFAVEGTMVRKSEKPPAMYARARPSPTLNILLVTARPAGRQDIAYRTISRPLIEMLGNTDLYVQVDLVRPGSFQALNAHLKNSHDQRGGSYYHIIHFDLHGGLLTHEGLQEGVTLDRYTFHATQKPSPYKGLKAYLFFDGEQNKQAHPVMASEVGELLASHQVPIAILNACQSAKQVGDFDVETSLGSRLMEAGVQVVLAMGYSVTVSATTRLMECLYRKLFEQEALPTAIRRARLALYEDKKRLAYYNQTISLEDWLLLVVYQTRAPQLPLREFTDEEWQRYLELRNVRYSNPAPSLYGFVGRDVEILQIEKRLLTHNVLLVRGMGGAGKTMLLHHLAEWWQTTNFVEQVFYFGYHNQAWTRQQIMHEIAQSVLSPGVYQRRFQPLSEKAQQRMLVKQLRAKRHLLILDNCESITGNALAIKNTLDSQQQAALKGFLAALAGGKTLILLGSRSSESWLMKDDPAPPLREQHIYELLGLDPEAASQLAERILLRHHVSHYHTDLDFRRLLKLLDGYPLALEVVLANLVHQTPSEVLSALQAGDIKLDSLDKADKTKSILRCIEYSHSNLSPDAQALLACLAPFTGIFNTGALDNYTKHLKQQPTLAHLPFNQWPTVLQEAINWGLLSPDPNSPSILRLQPIFPYFLRTHLNNTAETAMRHAIQAAFRQHYDDVGAALNRILRSKEAQQKQLGQLLTKWEYENLSTALNHALAAQVSIENLYRPLSTYLDSTQEQQRGLALGKTVLTQLEGYPPDKLTGPLGVGFVGVIDHIAKQQLLLREYAAAQTFYQKAQDILLKNKTYSAEQVREFSAIIYHQLGRVALQQHQWQEAEHYYFKALQINIDFNDRHAQGLTCHQLGSVALQQRQWQEAEQYYQKALQIFIEFNDRYSQGHTYHQLGSVALQQRQWQEAEQYYLIALQIKIDFNDHHAQASTYHQLGSVAQEQRQWQEAEQYYLKALQIKIDFNDRYGQGSTYHQLGSVAQQQRQWQEAEQYYLRALQIKIDFNDRHAQGSTYHQLGRVAEEQRQWQEAEQHYLKALDTFVAYKDKYSLGVVMHSLSRLWQASQDNGIPARVAGLLGVQVSKVDRLLRRF